MARGVPIWPDLKNLAIKWPGWQHWDSGRIQTICSERKHLFSRNLCIFHFSLRDLNEINERFSESDSRTFVLNVNNNHHNPDVTRIRLFLNPEFHLHSGTGPFKSVNAIAGHLPSIAHRSVEFQPDKMTFAFYRDVCTREVS